MVVMIDNYDSFTYNLVQYFCELGASLEVYRNDEITFDELRGMNPDKIIISPGPGRPDGSGISLEVVRNIAKEGAEAIPILGVCLGHQTLGQVFGAKIIRAKNIMHGKISTITHNNTLLFKGISNPFEATRYHSLVIDKNTLPDCFDVIARSEDDEIMGIAHKELPFLGVQFHPESILTVEGKKILGNFLKL